MITEVLEEIIDKSEPVQLPAPWRFLTPSQNVRCSTQCEDDFKKALESRFTAEQLEALKVYRRAQGQLELSPVLMRGRPFLVLRADKDGPPCDLVNQAGSLVSRKPPLLDCAHDSYIRERARSWKSILVAAGSIDVALLRMLHLPSVPAAGLAHMSGQDAQLLFEKQLAPPGRTPSKSAQAHTNLPNCPIIFVGWNPFAISAALPPKAIRILHQLRRAEAQLEIPGGLTPISVWTPSRQHLSSIGEAVRLKHAKLVRRAFEKSLELATFRLEEFFDNQALANLDLVAARSSLRQTLDQLGKVPGPSQTLAQQIAAADTAFTKQFFTPMLQWANAARDPLQQIIALQAADQAQLLHDSSPLMQSARMAAAGRPYENDGRLEAENSDTRIRNSKLFLEMVRELKRHP